MKKQVVEAIKADMGQVDLVVYNLASPRLQHSKTGAVHKSALKPIGQETCSAKTVDTDKGNVTDITIEPATEEEISDTVAIMGGEDWEMWIDALDEAGVLAPDTHEGTIEQITGLFSTQVFNDGAINFDEEGRARVHGRTPREIKHGLLVLIGVHCGDTLADAEWIAGKIPQLRMFDDDTGAMNRSVMDVEGGMLVISQFTLLGTSKNGT